MNVAIILAGGRGLRFGSETPKQFLPLAGTPIIEHSISAFNQCEEIDEVCVICNAEYIDRVEAILTSGRYPKLRHIAAGGTERSDSSLAAIRLYHNTPNCNLIFHDAVRPLVSQLIIHNVVAALGQYRAATAAIACTDTILQISSDATVAAIPPRATLRNVQTPQGFHLATISQAYALATADPAFIATDDCGVVSRYLPHVAIKVVEGDPANIKITHAADLTLAQRLLNR